MSFHRRHQSPSLGFAWLTPVVQLVGGALQSHPVEGQYIAPQQPTNSLLVVAGVLGGVAIAGGILYLVWRAR